ncbi:hypothetical protein [Aliiroseovarius sp. S253]|uniref:hypothetical protein n=1 Tax=Aliiroseovarius sp. S253 TaxID=3415133 RepID=UPI003C7D4E57
MATAVTARLRTAAKRHEVLAATDAAGSLAAADTVKELITHLDAEGIKYIAPLIKSGTIGNNLLRIKLSAVQLSEALVRKPEELYAKILDISAPFTIRRRGAEIKIIAGDLHLTRSSSRRYAMPTLGLAR